MTSLDSSEIYSLGGFVGTRSSHELGDEDLSAARAFTKRGLVRKVGKGYVISADGSELLSHIVGHNKEFTKVGQLRVAALAHDNPKGISLDQIESSGLAKYIPYCLNHDLLEEIGEEMYKITALGEGAITRIGEKARDYNKSSRIINDLVDVGHDENVITCVGLGDLSRLVGFERYMSSGESKVVDKYGNVIDRGKRDQLSKRWTFSRRVRH